MAQSVLLTLAGAAGGGDAGVHPIADAVAGPWWISLIPALPMVAAVVCLFMNFGRVRSKAPAWVVVSLLAAAFGITLLGFQQWNSGDGSPVVVKAWDWIHASWGGGGDGKTFVANVSFYMDGLSWLWMLFVTGLATMIGLYASEYMAGDKGYARFFAAFALFVVSMACLVMGDNLVLLYLGWEGVGLCSYLLIGYFYQKPAAVAAAKKAFIVNRIGDLGLALGIFLIYTTFGTVEYATLFALVGDGHAPVDVAGNAVTGWVTWAIPCLLMLGAFGKSAQLPLYVWLPDAMEGPTPVSALIHAATMVTAGVYLIARMFPMFAGLDGGHFALSIVAWVGTLTALLAATIGMAQFDIKRIMAYSTVSQLGYMFAGLGFLTTTGAAFHVFTHAFFKATLFLACGAVMHGFAGQLDLRKLSGLWSQPGWKIVTLAMFIGCINLAGVPFTAGYFSKDMILAEAFVTPGKAAMGWILLATAGLTAYYTFRVFFRVFVGPVHFEAGDEAHSHGDDDHGHGHGEEHHHDPGQHGDHHHPHFHPHPPGWAINLVLATLAIGSVVAAGTYFIDKDHHGWVGGLLHRSTASYTSPYGHHDAAHAMAVADVVIVPVADAHGGEAVAEAAHAGAGGFLGMDPHKVMYYVSAVVGLIGILTAAFLHGPRGLGGLLIGNRTEAATSRADGLLPMLGPIPKWAQHKWYVDELYHAIIVAPLWVLSNIFHLIDRVLVDGLVNVAGWAPTALAKRMRVTQDGRMHTYATGMGVGLAAVLIVVLVVVWSTGGNG